MKARGFFSFISCAILFLVGCSREARKSSTQIPQASDSLYTAHAAMMVYGSDPHKALNIVDSAVIVGNVSPYTADVLRAKIYANSPVDPRYDEAIALCKDLLQRDSCTSEDREEIFQVIMGAYRKKKDDENWLKYAIELADLNRELGRETEALRTEAEIGLVMTHLGYHDEGLKKLNDVIAALDKGDPSVDRMDAGIIARKRKIIVLDEDGNHGAIIPEASAIIQKLEDYQRRPEKYAEDSSRLPAGEDRARYISFYKSQAWAFLARAYAYVTPQNTQQARKYVSLFEESDYAQTLGGKKMISPAWMALGEWDKLLALDEELVSRMGADTLNADYATLLKNRADAATAKGNTAQALSYMHRYSALQQQLDQQLRQSEAQEYAAKYKSEEQARKIQEAERKAARQKVLIIVIVVFLLISMALSAYFAHKRHQINQQNRDLEEKIDAQSKESGPITSAMPDPELFRTIDGAIRSERMYVNPNLQRQNILDHFGISRRTLNDLLAAYAGGQSFTVYINSMRLEDAVSMMKENPEMSLTEISTSVGFTPATFRAQFKQKYGMTPTEYRQKM